jgi:hypothetical protein
VGQYVSTLHADGSFTCASPATVVDMSTLQPSILLATYSTDFNGPSPKPGWSYLWNANGALGNFNNYVPLKFATTLYTTDGVEPATNAALSKTGGVPGRGSTQGGISRAAIVGYTVPWDAAYAIVASSADAFNDAGCSDGVNVQVYRNNDLMRTVQLRRFGASAQSFDFALGYMTRGDTIYVAFNPLTTDTCDLLTFDFSVEATTLPAICDGSTGACTACPPGSRVVAGICQAASGDSVWNFEGTALDANRRLDGTLDSAVRVWLWV